MFHTDTIAAISTGMTSSGIGIVRLSGPDAVAIADKVYDSRSGKKLEDMPTHTIHYGFIRDGEEFIDEVLVMLMRGPRSFTAEDTVEINCHGGVYAMNRILELVIRKGARPAQPGEFTKRAFLNGRIDLSQAEAVIDVINAKNEYALKSSVSQLKGSVLKVIREIREKMLYHIAYIESALDDPEHISMDGYPQQLEEQTNMWKEKLQTLIASSENGKRMKEGITTVIVGKPNAGKSSLLNVLLGEERAIVTDIAGTTRDVLEEQMSMSGISLNIIDTAGIRNTEDVVEKIGVKKAKSYAKDADLIIYVVDSSTQLDENDEEIIELIRDRKVIVLLNKADLDPVTTEAQIKERLDKPVISVSAKEEQGLDQLELTVKNMFYEAFKDENIISLGEVKDGKQKYYIDTVLANINMMRSMGLKEENIIDSKICTVCNSDKMHSYRVEKELSGRNTAIIAIK